ncbi:MAG TPA: VCBS repeat-containing protein [Acidimicrobiales bacterium]|nr:VCBS repeat-containing protein [Acidimicrobiales bacterium]
MTSHDLSFSKKRMFAALVTAAASSLAAVVLPAGSRLVATASAAVTPSFQLVWSKDLPGAPFRASSPVAATLDAGGPAAVFGGLDGKVYAYHLSDGSPVPGWPVTLDKPVDSSPAAVDTDRSGLAEVYVGSGTYDSGTGGSYWALDHSGRAIYRFQGSDPNQAAEPVFSAPAVADLNCDGSPDVVEGALGQDTYALNSRSGAVLSGWPLFTYDTVFSSPAVAPVGGQTLVFEGGDSTTPKGGVLRAVNGAGQVIWSDQFDEVVTSSPAIGDVNGDGHPEIAVGTGFYWAQHGNPTQDSTALFLIDPATGHPLWSRSLGGFTRTSPALADLNGDGRPDIIEAVQGSPTNPNFGEIWAFDGSGHPLPGWPVLTPPNVGAVYGSPVTADLTGSGYQDVLVPTGDGMYVYDGRTGALVDSVAVNQLAMQNAPLVTQDPNGSLGVTLTGTNTSTGHGVVLHYQVAGGKVGANAWPMFHHDAARTGSLVAPPTTASGCGADGAGGYRFVAADGGVFDFGDATYHGSTGNLALAAPIVGMAHTPSDQGYWLVAQDGGIFNFGDAGFHGSAAGRGIKAVGMAAAPDGQGYWVVDDHGGVYAFGSARFFGSTGALTLAAPIAGMAITPDGGGYWLVGADGGIFSFGDARFYGSTGAIHLNQPIVGMAATPSGNGYWFVASDGGVFSFGNARFFGSTGAIHLNQPIVGMWPTPSGGGYWLVASDGGIFTFGNAGFFGSTGAIKLNQPIVAMADG